MMPPYCSASCAFGDNRRFAYSEKIVVPPCMISMFCRGSAVHAEQIGVHDGRARRRAGRPAIAVEGHAKDGFVRCSLRVRPNSRSPFWRRRVTTTGIGAALPPGLCRSYAITLTKSAKCVERTGRDVTTEPTRDRSRGLLRSLRFQRRTERGDEALVVCVDSVALEIDVDAIETRGHRVARDFSDERRAIGGRDLSGERAEIRDRRCAAERHAHLSTRQACKGGRHEHGQRGIGVRHVAAVVDRAGSTRSRSSRARSLSCVAHFASEPR